MGKKLTGKCINFIFHTVLFNVSVLKRKGGVWKKIQIRIRIIRKKYDLDPHQIFLDPPMHTALLTSFKCCHPDGVLTGSDDIAQGWYVVVVTKPTHKSLKLYRKLDISAFKISRLSMMENHHIGEVIHLDILS